VVDRAEGRSANALLLDHAVRNAILAERFKNAEARRILAVLENEVLPDLRARLAGRLENIASRGFDVGPRTTARLRFLFKDLRSFFDSLAERLGEETRPSLERFALGRAEQLAEEVSRLAGGFADVVVPTEAAVRAAVFSRPFDGMPMAERWARRARKFRESVESQVRTGLFQGESADRIVARVRAEFPTQARLTASVARSAVAQAQAQARQATFEANADLIAGVMWVATLDVDTCPECGLLDGQVLPLDSGARPPLHPGPCRCTTTAVLRSARELGFTRASMDGHVPEVVKWEEWITEQPPERQVTSLGKGVAELFQAGRLRARDLVSGAGDRLSLHELERLAAAS